ncbi:hypothetical protein BJ508DRAFT_329273 [Ascobolus immersus RN42]|uniref:Uncharacterized protein n=1 Tax=Ascobolus immersus RN42 TaxID=1160509 RepID=A0A3N4I959_ASCIM|nr:hypothetical protein BJ508DRAFT_329273 [Ascobolus immersus RN42]
MTRIKTIARPVHLPKGPFLRRNLSASPKRGTSRTPVSHPLSSSSDSLPSAGSTIDILVSTDCTSYTSSIHIGCFADPPTPEDSNQHPRSPPSSPPHIPFEMRHDGHEQRRLSLLAEQEMETALVLAHDPTYKIPSGPLNRLNALISRERLRVNPDLFWLGSGYVQTRNGAWVKRQESLRRG